VITVGAHGRSGTKAPFSNFSSEFVDLLAPGCGIDTRDGDGATVRDSGTSPAAALVSFTAGLIKAAGVEEAAAIKTRILAAVDHDETLADQAWSRGRLNAIKALSLRRDVVETSDGDLLFGIIEDRAPLLALCDDPDSDFSHTDDVYKVIANIETPGGPKVEYWIYTDGLLSRRRCAQKEIGDTIRLGERPIAVSTISDVVFNWFGSE
jgi:subtilisin family serine protease